MSRTLAVGLTLHSARTALVTGVQKLNPWGTAVAGMLLPREKPPLEFVPRLVITQCRFPSPASRVASNSRRTITKSE